MKKIFIRLAIVAAFVAPLAMVSTTAASGPNWNVTGNYVINVNYLSVDYPENLVLQQSGSNITGTSLALLDSSYPWTIDAGSVVGNVIDFEGYLNSTPAWRVHFSGTIAVDGSMSGTWADVAVGTRSGTWASTSGLASGTVQVHIFKYFITGAAATVETAGGVSFPMFTSTYNAPFTLGPSGWTTGDAPYEASTAPMPVGSSYSAQEDLSTPLVGATCDGAHQYALLGYVAGDVLNGAGLPDPTVPSFTNLQSDKYVAVVNAKCDLVQAPTIKVHILKYLDGVKADAVSSGGYQFPMTATWEAANLNGGVSTSGSYVLGNNHGGATDQYGADTSPMNTPADYTTSEITDSTSQVVSSPDACAPGKYLLNGYRTSPVDFATAASQALTVAAPVFTGLTSDRYVIVDNSNCPTGGSISGMKYNDLNRNGQKDANEPGLSGWVIRLISNDKVVATTTTAADGSYSFQNIAPGTYDVRETHQKGWKRMSKNPKDIVILAGSVVTGVNFGNAATQKGEKDDTDKDDNRDDQSGKYYSGHGKSNYDKDQNNKDHETDSDSGRGDSHR